MVVRWLWTGRCTGTERRSRPNPQPSVRTDVMEAAALLAEALPQAVNHQGGPAGGRGGALVSAAAAGAAGRWAGRWAAPAGRRAAPHMAQCTSQMR